MDLTGPAAAGVALLAATAYGLVHRRRAGTVRAVPAADDTHAPLLAELGVRPGAVTLLQFSSAFCAPCRATRVVLGEVARATPGVAHVEVDAESRLDAVRALDIWKTPTVLIVDGEGRIAGRAQGTPTRAQVLAAITPLLPTAVPPAVLSSPPGSAVRAAAAHAGSVRAEPAGVESVRAEAAQAAAAQAERKSA
ncbi:TlpA family protein disulfide reductase [Catellatospora bangladeshensis]|uniref:Thioredoxin domain-containing protein n=1 Tax=Catellatospora bangladeshensis TaxID=310355 RepID=A0A8J3JRV0_9ACTN|nr:thioredoxin family protein [Catellatospora bangladeshensis]GIF83985.1 hypothetical protein Cba03nite_53340 [Catellatospora bangladeshensis]